MGRRRRASTVGRGGGESGRRGLGFGRSVAPASSSSGGGGSGPRWVVWPGPPRGGRLLTVDYRIKVHMDLQANKSTVVVRDPSSLEW
jgi:hypothetical protein